MKAKNILAAVTCLCLAAPMTICHLPQNSNYVKAADTAESIYDIYLYKDYGDYVEITSVSTNASGIIEVPAEINDLPVRAIGDHAFYGNTKITSVKLPDTLAVIGKQAFAMCSNLANVNIPLGVTEISDETFLNCIALAEISLPTDLTSIGTRAFYGCKNLTEISIPYTVSAIGAQAFENCSSFTSITLPSRLTSLAEGTFNGCNSITELTIHSGIESIGMQALPKSLTTLTILNPDCTIDESYYMWNITTDCKICAPSPSKAQEFAEKYGFTFMPITAPQAITGDVNDDGFFNVADVYMLQYWLLGSGNLTKRSNADINGDGTVDIFDFCLMRKALIETKCFYETQNLSADIKSNLVTGAEADEEFVLGQTEFALSLLQKTVRENTNTLISPYSVMQALAMTANGADGITKSEMEQTLGGLPIEKLNEYLYTQRISQPDTEYCKLSTANSIWSRDDESRISVNPEFLQTNADYYDADIFKAPFDNNTLTDINNWVNEKTDGMIQRIIDEIDITTVMYLINAVAFDAKWEIPYDETQVMDYNFTAYDGTVQSAEMMLSDEYYYLDDENAVGIYKYYEGRSYAFAALLPNEGISVKDYIEQLTPESLIDTLSNPQKAYINAGIPKFSYDFDAELSTVLAQMGMPDAFSGYADFSKMADTANGALYISKVLHKTHIDVFEEGTKAAAVTAVAENDTSILPKPDREIILDRPFVYCIVDTETNLPVFIGTLESIPE